MKRLCRYTHMYVIYMRTHLICIICIIVTSNCKYMHTHICKHMGAHTHTHTHAHTRTHTSTFVQATYGCCILLHTIIQQKHFNPFISNLVLLQPHNQRPPNTVLMTSAFSIGACEWNPKIYCHTLCAYMKSKSCPFPVRHCVHT